MPCQWSLQEAKSKFSEVVNAACNGIPQVVTQQGQPTVVILSNETYQHLLKQLQSTPQPFRDLLLAEPQLQDNVDSDTNMRAELNMREIDF